MDGVITGASMSDFAQQLRRKNAEVPDIYSTLLDAACKSPSLVLNQNAKTKDRGSWVFSKQEYQELEKLHTSNGAADGFVQT